MSPKFPNEVYSEQNILIASRQVKWEDTSLLVAASPLNVKMLLLSLYFFCEVYVHLSISDRDVTLRHNWRALQGAAKTH